MATRIGVDVGGTFTDLIFIDEEAGEVRVAKGPSTPAAPDDGVVDVVVSALPPDALARAKYFLHGTTVGINSLLERKGARVGLLTTKGFRDVLEMGRGDRIELYNPQWKAPPPLVPRALRAEASERVRADGTIDIPLEPDDVAAAARLFAEEGVESVAVVFLNAHAFPEHERRAAVLLKEHGFDGAVSLSHEVSGEFREYERTSTTVVDAYIRPRVSSYFRRLRERLLEAGFQGECFVTRSGGGAMRFVDAEARPFETVMSGPVAGAMGTSELCEQLGMDRAITADVGGTSFDTCLVVDGRPPVRYEGEVEGLPLQTPWVDVRSIGAGGGSIAYDEHGVLHVGPRSAGAEPGPVCYRRGGTEPTTTDAAATLGMLGFGELASGLTLDFDGARGAVDDLAGRLGLGRDEAARGILTVAAVAMAGAIRGITVEAGEDPRDATLVAFGGAGPLFGCLLAAELDISRIVVPVHAGNFSAWGVLAGDVTRAAARTTLVPLDSGGLAQAEGVLDELWARLETDEPNGAGESVLEPALDLRYRGQEYALTIPGQATADGRLEVESQTLLDRFESNYSRAYGHTLSSPVEIVSVRATRRTPLPGSRVERSAAVDDHREIADRELEAYSFTAAGRVPFRVVARETIPVGQPLAGPVIVTEQTTTTYIDQDWGAVISADGVLTLERELN